MFGGRGKGRQRAGEVRNMLSFEFYAKAQGISVSVFDEILDGRNQEHATAIIEELEFLVGQIDLQ